MSDVLMQAAAINSNEQQQQGGRRSSVYNNINVISSSSSSVSAIQDNNNKATSHQDVTNQQQQHNFLIQRDNRDYMRTKEDVVYDITRLRNGEQITLRVAANRRDKIDVIRIGQAPFAFNGKKDGSWIPDGMAIHSRADKVDYIVETKVVGPMLVEFSFTPAIEKTPGKWEKDPSKPTFTNTSALKAYNDAYKYTHKTAGTLKGANARLIMGIHYPHMQDLIKKMFNLSEPPTSEPQAKSTSRPKKRTESNANSESGDLSNISTRGSTNKTRKQSKTSSSDSAASTKDNSSSDIGSLQLIKNMAYPNINSALNWIGDSREYTGLVALASMAVQTPRTAAAAAAAGNNTNGMIMPVSSPGSLPPPPPPPPAQLSLAWPTSPPSSSPTSSAQFLEQMAANMLA
jgi:hypothetical protein